VPLQDLLEQTLALRLHQLSVSGIAVRREYADALPAVAADPHQLQQVFLNLLLNAEQAVLGSGKGGEIVIRIAAGATKETVIVQVIDDGPGIAAENVGRVFEPFYTTKDVGQGTGLGLSVSYGIVQEHGGRLTVDSQPGATIFTVELPVRSTLPRTLPSLVDAPAAVDRRPVLVVEDEPAVLELMVTLLSNTGWAVDVASGGRAALERVQARHYDLIVSDVRMPEGGGDEFFRQAVALDAALARRFLFITGDTANPQAWRFLKEARVPVLEKPFAASAFLDAVRLIATLTASTTRAYE
jgi:CheY-like chemotaxis protein